MENAELAGITEAMADGWSAVLTVNFQQKTEELKVRESWFLSYLQTLLVCFHLELLKSVCVCVCVCVCMRMRMCICLGTTHRQTPWITIPALDSP